MDIDGIKSFIFKEFKSNDKLPYNGLRGLTNKEFFNLLAKELQKEMKGDNSSYNEKESSEEEKTKERVISTSDLIISPVHQSMSSPMKILKLGSNKSNFEIISSLVANFDKLLSY